MRLYALYSLILTHRLAFVNEKFDTYVFYLNHLYQFSDKIVLVSYNLLGVDNASNHMDLYDNVSPKHLEWNRRKHLICTEISRYNASILCLQASFEVYYIRLHTVLDV